MDYLCGAGKTSFSLTQMNDCFSLGIGKVISKGLECGQDLEDHHEFTTDFRLTFIDRNGVATLKEFIDLMDTYYELLEQSGQRYA